MLIIVAVLNEKIDRQKDTKIYVNIKNTSFIQVKVGIFFERYFDTRKVRAFTLWETFHYVKLFADFLLNPQFSTRK